MNIAVITSRDIAKYLVRITVIIILIVVFTRFFNSINLNSEKAAIIDNIGTAGKKITTYSFAQCLDVSLSLMSYNKQGINKADLISSSSILDLSLSMFGMKDVGAGLALPETADEVGADSISAQLTEDNVGVELTSLGTPEANPAQTNLPEKSNVSYGNVKIYNQSKYTLTEDMMSPDVSHITNRKDIIIYHTHTCESYTPSSKYAYNMTGNYRTTDLNFNVARVGSELTAALQAKGFNVLHDTTYNDYPAYNGSYAKSLASLQADLKKMPSCQLVIDMHRDAVGSNDTYGPTAEINGETTAQILIISGTDTSGLDDAGWNQNLKLAVALQQKGNEMYPGLFRPIQLSENRYNMNITSGALLIEVGATGNTLDQAIASMKYLADVYAAVLGE